MLANSFYLWRLVLAHLLADYVLQNNKIAKWKAESPLGILVHASIFLVLAVLLTILKPIPVFTVDFSILSNMWLILSFLGVTHFLIDHGRVRAVKKLGWSDNFWFFLLDQFMHLALIWFVVTVFSYSGTLEIFPSVPENWTIILSIYIAASYFMTILVFYLEKGENKQKVIGGQEKYYGIIERLLVCILFTLPGNIYLLTPIVFLGRAYMYFFKRDQLVFDFFNVYLANILAIICGISIRFLVLR